MTELIFFFGMGVAVLLVLTIWVSSRVPHHHERMPFRELQDTLAPFALEIPSSALAKRIFALEDWEFVTRRAPPAVRRLFAKERKALAFSWLRSVRQAVRKLMDFHRRTVRGNSALNPW